VESETEMKGGVRNRDIRVESETEMKGGVRNRDMRAESEESETEIYRRIQEQKKWLYPRENVSSS